MAARIEQHVCESVTHLSRCPQNVEVIAVREHPPAPTKNPIHGPRYARTDRFHSRGEIPLARRLDDRVHVVVLDRVVNQAEAPAFTRRSEAAFQRTYDLHAEQRRKPAPHLQRDVTRKTRCELRTRPV